MFTPNLASLSSVTKASGIAHGALLAYHLEQATLSSLPAKRSLMSYLDDQVSTGFSGSSGTSGVTGSLGSSGSVGTSGTTGASGLSGSTGSTGISGSSAGYEPQASFQVLIVSRVRGAFSW
ncbi:MAG: hypothetical protein IJ445_07060 [Clostridia bacterium]|nr:hypothetical protein [Clostridia bacterium]